MEEFESAFDAAMRSPVFAHLQHIVRTTASPGSAEGCVWFFGGQGGTDKCHEFEHKRRNLFRLARGATNALEVGFNAGHSAAIMLLAGAARVTCFDLGRHAYTRPALQALQEAFPGRVNVVFGDSRLTLPEFFASAVPDFDLLHVDGGHARDVLESDLFWTRQLAKPCGGGHVVVIDDSDVPEIAAVLREHVDAGKLCPLHHARDASDALDALDVPADGGGMRHFVGTFR